MTYTSIAGQAGMLFDAVRNSAYARAIRASVDSRSVVLDLGAGLGLHGLVAAAAGARRVYLVEPEAVARIASEIAQANGLADRVVILHDRIENLQPPERVDLIVSVMTGNLLFSEDLLGAIYHARDHWLRPGGVMLPDRAELCFAPIHDAALHQKYLGRWSLPVEGLDVSVARRFAANEPIWLPPGSSSPKLLADPFLAADLDLTAANEVDCDADAEVRITRGGVCHGLLGWTRIRIGQDWLSTGPSDSGMHWSRAVLPFDEPVEFREDESIRLRVVRPTRGHWTWAIRSKSANRSQSEVMASPDVAERLRRIAPDRQPRLDRSGVHLVRLLQLFDGHLSLRDIADRLHTESPEVHPTRTAALAYVQSVAERFAQDRLGTGSNR